MCSVQAPSHCRPKANIHQATAETRRLHASRQRRSLARSAKRPRLTTHQQRRKTDHQHRPVQNEHPVHILTTPSPNNPTNATNVSIPIYQKCHCTSPAAKRQQPRLIRSAIHFLRRPQKNNHQTGSSLSIDITLMPLPSMPP
jgi:hypothetical protein